MAGLGIGPEDFDLFEIDAPEQRSRALERQVSPKLDAIASGLLPGLSRVAGRALHPHASRLQRKKGYPPGEVFVAFGASDKGYRAGPHLTLAVTRDHLHARVAVCGAGDHECAMTRALQREAVMLAKKGKPFRRLRHYGGWDHDAELPEVAPAHSAAFWLEVADEIGGSPPTTQVAVGVAWAREEARSLSVGDLLGAYRDLAPIYKLLAAASATAAAQIRGA